jgi:tRNA(Ile)-lysidine synthase
MKNLLVKTCWQSLAGHYNQFSIGWGLHGPAATILGSISWNGWSMHSLEQKLLAAWPCDRWENMTVAVAVSGGPDSMALATSLDRLRPPNTRLVIVHIHHGLRGAEADDDARSVVRWAIAHGHRCCVGGRCMVELQRELTGSGAQWIEELTPLAEVAASDEDGLRKLRYRLLESAARGCGARYIALGHTADDQAETVLYHLLRGTGIRGLAGIPSFRELHPDSPLILVRPLLDSWRREVIEYLASLQVPYRIDSSNAQTHYRRNWIRGELMPLLDSLPWPVRQHLVQLADQSREIDDWLSEQGNWIAVHCRSKEPQVRIPQDRISSLPWPVVQAGLRRLWIERSWPLGPMGYRSWMALKGWIESPSMAPPTLHLPGGVHASRQGEEIVLEVRLPDSR